jgi:hypothetical protein
MRRCCKYREWIWMWKALGCVIATEAAEQHFTRLIVSNLARDFGEALKRYNAQQGRLHMN